MVSRFRIKREKEYPQPHDFSSGIALDVTAANASHWLEIMQDESVLPAAVFTNPEHASFAPSTTPNCSTDSEITNVFTEIRFSMSALMINDHVGAVRIGFIPWALAFEDAKVIDDKTSVEIRDVLELDDETTDKQTYPLWNDTDFTVKYTGSSTLGAGVPGLDGTQLQEKITFDIDLWYDVLRYYTISNKLRSLTKGLRWITLTENNPTRRILIRQKSNAKRMNKYTAQGVLWTVPVASSKYQIPMVADVTSGISMTIEQQTRFLEWNVMYHSERA